MAAPKQPETSQAALERKIGRIVYSPKVLGFKSFSPKSFRNA